MWKLFAMVLMIVVPISVAHGCGEVGKDNEGTRSLGERCGSCEETALEQQKCVENGFDHAVKRACGHGYACLSCADKRGVLTPMESPYNAQAPASTVEKPAADETTAKPASSEREDKLRKLCEEKLKGTIYGPVDEETCLIGEVERRYTEDELLFMRARCVKMVGAVVARSET